MDTKDNKSPKIIPTDSIKHGAESIKHGADRVVKGFEKRRPLINRATLKNIRFVDHILKRTDKVLLTLFLLITIGGGLWLAGRGLMHFTAAVPAYGGEYTEGVVGQPKYVNPLYANSNEADLDLTKMVYSSLVDLGPKGEIINDLADKIDVSEDQKTYTIHLAANVQWQDGQTFDAQDVIFTVNAIQSLDYNSPLRSSLRGVTVEKPDDQTVVFKLREVYAPFLTNLTFGILPSHIWATIPAASAILADQNTKPIGTGPYKFKELTRDASTGAIRSYTLEANPNYFKRRAYIDSFTFRYFSDMQAATDALKAGGVNGLSLVDVDHLNQVPAAKTAVEHVVLPRFYAFFLNTDRELLKDGAVRNALAFGLNKTDLTHQVVDGAGIVVDSPILPGFFGYTDDFQKRGYDVDTAKKWLDDAGWKVVEGKVAREKNGKALALNLVTTDYPEFNKVAEIAKGYWAAIGIDVTTKSVSVSEAQSKNIRPRDYDMLLYGEVMGADPDPFAFWHSTQKQDPGLNLSMYNSDTVDRLLEEARQTVDPAVRAGKYQEFLKRLASDVPAIFLYSPEYLYPVSKSLHGADFQTLVLPSDRMNSVADWFLRTKRVWRKG